jgi:hypothetical protein
MAPKRTLKPQSVWDQAAVLEAFSQAGVRESHAYRLWGCGAHHRIADTRPL